MPPPATGKYAKSYRQISPNRLSIDKFILGRESVDEFIPGSSWLPLLKSPLHVGARAVP